MARVLAVSNQKGGVGKTTSVVNLAAFCALAGKRTLVIDNDPQGNASSVLAPDFDGHSIYAKPAVLATKQDRLSVIPAGNDLLDWDRKLGQADRGVLALRERVNVLRPDFDLIFIDCPPNLSCLPTNALLAADDVLIPIQAEYFALEGLSQLLAYMATLRAEWNAPISLAGVLLTMYDPRHPIAVQVYQEVRRHFGDQALPTPIPRDIALAAAPSHSKTILDYDPLSPGGLAYLAASKELLHGLR